MMYRFLRFIYLPQPVHPNKLLGIGEAITSLQFVGISNIQDPMLVINLVW